MKYLIIAIMIATSGFAIAQDDCYVGQNPPTLSSTAQAELLSQPAEHRISEYFHRTYTFKDGSTLIAQWAECEIGIEMVYLTPTELSEQQRIEKSLWLVGLIGDPKYVEAGLPEALGKIDASGTSFFERDDGALMEFKLSKLINDAEAPAAMFTHALSFRFFGPAGLD